MKTNTRPIFTGWWLGHPSEKNMSSSIGMIRNPILMGKCQKWQPNHQPVYNQIWDQHGSTKPCCAGNPQFFRVTVSRHVSRVPAVPLRKNHVERKSPPWRVAHLGSQQHVARQFRFFSNENGSHHMTKTWRASMIFQWFTINPMIIIIWNSHQNSWRNGSGIGVSGSMGFSHNDHPFFWGVHMDSLWVPRKGSIHVEPSTWMVLA